MCIFVAKCRHECVKNTQCNAINVFRAHTRDYMHLNEQYSDNTWYHAVDNTDTRGWHTVMDKHSVQTYCDEENVWTLYTDTFLLFLSYSKKENVNLKSAKTTSHRVFHDFGV